MAQRSLLLGILALAALAIPLATEAQQQRTVYRIGWLEPLEKKYVTEAFRQGLRELGYIEGQNIIIESRSARGQFERLPGLAAELVQLKVDVIAASSTPAALAAKNATTTIPIVAMVGDPVAAGLVTSLARPGGNVTGVSVIAPAMVAKQLQLLKEAVPHALRVAVLWESLNPALATPMLSEAERAARVLGLQLQLVGVQSPEEFEGAFATMTRGDAQAVLAVPSALFFHHRKRLADLSATHGLPAMHGFQAHAEAGDLMVYEAPFSHAVRRAATFVDKILKGAKPADLPVEQPMKFELTINLKTAKALGLTMPSSLLLRADRVIE